MSTTTTDTTDDTAPKRRGPARRASARRRGQSIRLAPDEWRQIDAQRGELSRADYLVSLVLDDGAFLHHLRALDDEHVQTSTPAASAAQHSRRE
jgi:hypothetical protein